MARVVDCFIFNDELDLLSIHLHELNDVVDYFVLAEATTSFSGEPKPLHFQENRSRFAPFLDRIHAIAVNFPEGMKTGWIRLSHQREALMEGLVDSAPDDVILLTDVDEIVRATALKSFVNREADCAEIGCFELRHFNYFLNWECASRWLRNGPRAVRHKYLHTLDGLRRVRGPSTRRLQDISRAIDAAWRMRRPINRLLIPDAGWHFTYLGGPQSVIQKARSFVGCELSDVPYRNIASVVEQIADGRAVMPEGQQALRLRAIDASFPQYVRDHPHALQALIADEETPNRLRWMLETGAFGGD